MLGIIGAMEEEVNEILALMKVEKEYQECNYHFYEGFLGKKEVVVVQGGIGKVNAAISATLLLKNFDIDHVINVGSAGGLDLKENVGDVIISEKVVHHDVDVTAFGHPYGQIPDKPLYYEADPALISYAKEIFEHNGLTVYSGLIVSGDQFVARKDQVDAIKEHFPDALCSEMEAATVAQVCTVFNKPFIIARGLSDIFDKGSSSIQFDQYLKEAAKSSAHMCYDLAQKLI